MLVHKAFHNTYLFIFNPVIHEKWNTQERCPMCKCTKMFPKKVGVRDSVGYITKCVSAGTFSSSNYFEGNSLKIVCVTGVRGEIVCVTGVRDRE